MYEFCIPKLFLSCWFSRWNVGHSWAVMLYACAGLQEMGQLVLSACCMTWTFFVKLNAPPYEALILPHYTEHFVYCYWLLCYLPSGRWFATFMPCGTSSGVFSDHWCGWSLEGMWILASSVRCDIYFIFCYGLLIIAIWDNNLYDFPFMGNSS
jgi:hypothetical protein